MVPAPVFSLLGGRFAIFPETLFAFGIDATVQDGGLRIVVHARENVQFAAVCVAGACTHGAVFARIVWRSGTLGVRLAAGKHPGPAKPDRGGHGAVGKEAGAGLEARVAAELAAVDVGGQFLFECPGGLGLSEFICASARAAVGTDVTGLVRERAQSLRRRANLGGLQAIISAALAVGGVAREWGDLMARLRVRGITADARGMHISFCLDAHCP